MYFYSLKCDFPYMYNWNFIFIFGRNICFHDNSNRFRQFISVFTLIIKVCQGIFLYSFVQDSLVNSPDLKRYHQEKYRKMFKNSSNIVIFYTIYTCTISAQWLQLSTDITLSKTIIAFWFKSGGNFSLSYLMTGNCTWTHT